MMNCHKKPLLGTHISEKTTYQPAERLEIQKVSAIFGKKVIVGLLARNLLSERR